jgi:dUTP pyrophosphatase
MDTQAPELRFYVHPHAADLPLPRYGTDGGIILRSAGPDVDLLPGENLLADTGLRLVIPSGWVGLIRSRGGMYARYGLSARHESIGADFIDDLKVTLRLQSGATRVSIARGDCIAQLILVPAHQAKLCAMTLEQLAERMGHPRLPARAA